MRSGANALIVSLLRAVNRPLPEDVWNRTGQKSRSTGESSRSPGVAETPHPFFAPDVLAWVCFFRVMFDGVFARDVSNVRERGRLPEVRPPMQSLPAIFPPATSDTALVLLALFQREGRLV